MPEDVGIDPPKNVLGVVERLLLGRPTEIVAPVLALSVSSLHFIGFVLMAGGRIWASGWGTTL